MWITCGLLWCFYQLFGLSFWRHPFTAEDPLVSKWCNATFLQICPDEETNLSTEKMCVWLSLMWSMIANNIQSTVVLFLCANTVAYSLLFLLSVAVSWASLVPLALLSIPQFPLWPCCSESLPQYVAVILIWFCFRQHMVTNVK